MVKQQTNLRWENFVKKYSEKIALKRANEKQVKDNGGDKYLQLEARLKDPTTGKLGEDIVIYAMRTISEESDAKSFVEGYVNQIQSNMKKYPAKIRSDVKGYVQSEIIYVLRYFGSQKVHELWEKILGGLENILDGK